MSFRRAAPPPQQTESGVNQFLDLIADPFSSQVTATSIKAALIYSFGVSTALAIGFCILRPRTSTVYAPRAKYADEKHAPPPVGRGFFSWVTPIRTVKDVELVEKIGLDATVFLRFLRMTRNIFIALTVVGCGVLIPVNLVGGHNLYSQYHDISILVRLTPQFNYGAKFWVFVACAYVFDIIIAYFLWREYRAVTRLRRAYFDNPEYRASLHSRTLMLTHVPRDLRTDQGLTKIIAEVKVTANTPRGAIARNVRELPELIEDHDEAVHELEKCLASYLSNPNKLPTTRPLCKPVKSDRARTREHKVDAIDYWTSRIKELEIEIKQVRESLDKRNPMPYGFASYNNLEDAHALAYAARGKKPKGATIRLAPRPNDIIWKNLAISRAGRRARSVWNSLWMIALTIFFIAPNILTSVFLSDLAHLGKVWPAFQSNLEAHGTLWGIVQGILAPAIQTLFYLFLPTFFRRLLNHAGDTTKTSRERHVTNKLFGFFVFNNLIVFSIFAAAWQFISAVIAAKQQGVWAAVKQGHLLTKLVLGLINISPYWLTWQMQRNLGAATDLLQLWTLIWGTFIRKVSSPTPRRLIELSAPQPFQYASYYNNYLFCTTIGLCFGPLQPLILPITAIFMAVDYWFKKYMLQYIAITKTESGGAFWRILFNRCLFATLLGNIVVALLVAAQGYDLTMLYSMIPIIPLLAAFKLFCSYSFDSKMTYYTTTTLADSEGASSTIAKMRGSDRVGVRFGHPALYKKLVTPMVHAKSQHLLKEVYRGRLDAENDLTDYGYGDYPMSEMSSSKLGKPDNLPSSAPFEIVSEADMDFENFKRRAEFRDEHGGDGELYGRPDDLISERPGTPSMASVLGLSTASTAYERRHDSYDSSLAREPAELGTSYPTGYHAAVRGDASPHRFGERKHALERIDSADVTLGARHPAFRGAELDEGGLDDSGFFDDESIAHRRGITNDDDDAASTRGRLLRNAATMGLAAPRPVRPGQAAGIGSNEHGGLLAVTPGPDEDSVGGSLMATPTEMEGGDTSYDYFRRGRGA